MHDVVRPLIRSVGGHGADDLFRGLTSQRGNPLVAAFRAMAGSAGRGKLSTFLVLCRIVGRNEQDKARKDKGTGDWSRALRHDQLTAS